MNAARDALTEAGLDGAWGADGDHLKTKADIDITASTGFCFFTIDPSEFVENRADMMEESELNAKVEKMVEDGILPSNWTENYLWREFDIGQGEPLRFEPGSLHRAAVKYARAIDHCGTLSAHISSTVPPEKRELELSVDETDSPTYPLEHLFFAL